MDLLGFDKTQPFGRLLLLNLSYPPHQIFLRGEYQGLLVFLGFGKFPFVFEMASSLLTPPSSWSKAPPLYSDEELRDKVGRAQQDDRGVEHDVRPGQRPRLLHARHVHHTLGDDSASFSFCEEIQIQIQIQIQMLTGNANMMVMPQAAPLNLEILCYNYSKWKTPKIDC